MTLIVATQIWKMIPNENGEEEEEDTTTQPLVGEPEVSSEGSDPEPVID